MEKFTHVESFHHVCKYVAKVNADDRVPEGLKIFKPVIFRGTVKLHGTNSGVACTKQGLRSQSRNRTISVTDDNLNFAKFIADEKRTNMLQTLEAFIRNIYVIDADINVTLYGEWIGPGIQKGVAVNQLPERQWVLFAVKAGEDYVELPNHLPELRGLLEDVNVFCIDKVQPQYVEVDFSDAQSKQRALDTMEALTAKYEEECPWGKLFDISGIGEGLVWVPIDDQFGRSDLFFKTKGEKHSVVSKERKPRKEDPEVARKVGDFVAYAVTDNRLNQGLDFLREMKKPIEMQSTGDFLKWLGNDVQRECDLELKEAGLEWKMVAQTVTIKARDWFKNEVNKI